MSISISRYTKICLHHSTWVGSVPTTVTATTKDVVEVVGPCYVLTNGLLLERGFCLNVNAVVNTGGASSVLSACGLSLVSLTAVGTYILQGSTCLGRGQTNFPVFKGRRLHDKGGWA